MYEKLEVNLLTGWHVTRTVFSIKVLILFMGFNLILQINRNTHAFKFTIGMPMFLNVCKED